jgi:quercetin dioxygenase-like cupin family protein
MTKLLTSIVVASMLMVPFATTAQDVPDAMSVEWQGKKPCENLHEDDQIRIMRCTFPPGAKHLRHQHPTEFFYTLSGGKLENQSAAGTRQREAVTDDYAVTPPIPWHEVTNIGDTTLRYVVVEMKYKR